MRVRLNAFGIPGIQGGDREVEFHGVTLEDLRQRLSENRLQSRSLNEAAVAFVNGKAVNQDWRHVTVSDGDAVMLIFPMSGG